LQLSKFRKNYSQVYKLQLNKINIFKIGSFKNPETLYIKNIFNWGYTAHLLPWMSLFSLTLEESSFLIHILLVVSGTETCTINVTKTKTKTKFKELSIYTEISKKISVWQKQHYMN
jgi:hypothetical protein